MMEMGKKGPPPEPGTGAQIREKATRAAGADPTRTRVYTPAFKERILREVAEARASGERGAMAAVLRREGLVRSLVFQWEQAQERLTKKGLEPKRRGRPRTKNPLADTVARLERENARLKKELYKAEVVIYVQKKLSALLGIAMPPRPEEDEKP